MDFQMTLLDANGKEIECNIIAKWSQDDNHYLAYTDGSTTDGELNLFVSKYRQISDNFKLEEITDETEWAKVNKYLDENLYNLGDLNG